MKQTELFEIRELRHRGWFWLDNEFIDSLAPRLGPFTCLVYVYLCRRTDKETQKCYPAIQTIADDLKISTRIVIKAIRELELAHLIGITREKEPRTKRWKVNVYTLLDKKEWRNKSQVYQMHMEPGAHKVKSQVHQVACKETQDNKTQDIEVRSEPLPCSISKAEFIKQAIGAFMAAFEAEYSSDGKKAVYRVVRGKDHKLLGDEYDRLVKLGFTAPDVELNTKLAIAFAWDRKKYPGRPKSIGRFLACWNDYMVEVTDEERAREAARERDRRQREEQVLSLARDFIFRNQNQKLNWDAWVILRNFDRPRFAGFLKTVKAKVEELKKLEVNDAPNGIGDGR